MSSDRQQVPKREQETPGPSIDDEGNLVAEVESILDHRYSNRKLQYLLKFKGFQRSEAEWHTFSAEDPTWEEDLGLVVAYQEKHGYPQQPARRRRQPDPPAEVLGNPPAPTLPTGPSTAPVRRSARLAPQVNL